MADGIEEPRVPTNGIADLFSALRDFLRLLRTSGPPESLKPPKGRHVLASEYLCVRATGTGEFQGAIQSVFEMVREDSDGDVVVCAWLSPKPDTNMSSTPIDLCVGSSTVGWLGDETLSQDKLRSLKKLLRRRRSVWVDAFIRIESNEYVVDVNLPLPVG